MVLTLCELGTSSRTALIPCAAVTSPNSFLASSPMPPIPSTSPLSTLSFPTPPPSKFNAHSPTSSARTRSNVPLVASTRKLLPTPLSCHSTQLLQKLSNQLLQ